jgi:N-acetylmuramoyl-L-alanine amidase
MDANEMYEVVLLGLCIWRESRNQPKIAQEGVGWTVKNRASTPGWWGKSIVSVILLPFQYSSFNRNDPNAVKLPSEDDTAWVQCLGVAQDVWQGISTDPTSGCQNYFDRSLDTHPPIWSTDGSYAHVTDLGDLRFFRRN